MKLSKDKKGSIAITLVIVISSMLLAGGMNLLLSNIDFTRATVNYRSRQIAVIISKSCLEESLYKLKEDINFTGTFSVPFTDGNCDSTVSNLGGGLKTISVQTSYLDYQLTKNFQVNTIVYPYDVNEE